MANYSNLDRLNGTWKTIKFHQNIILEILVDVQKYNLSKINAEELVNLSLLQRALIDSLMFRFMLIQDTLGSKVLPLIAELRLGDNKSVLWLDVLAQLEKIHVITSEETWQELLEMRNQITHDYSQEPQLRLEFIHQLFKSTNILLEQINLLEITIAQLNDAASHN